MSQSHKTLSQQIHQATRFGKTQPLTWFSSLNITKKMRLLPLEKNRDKTSKGKHLYHNCTLSTRMSITLDMYVTDAFIGFSLWHPAGYYSNL